MTDNELTTTLDNLHDALSGHEKELERLKATIAYQKKQIKKFEAEQQRRQAWAEKNRLPSAG